MLRYLLLLLLCTLVLAVNVSNSTNTTTPGTTPISNLCIGRSRYKGCKQFDELTAAAIVLASLAGAVFLGCCARKMCPRKDYEETPTEDT